jgi:hypothetical protein
LLGEDSPAGTSKRQGFSEGSDRWSGLFDQ